MYMVMFVLDDPDRLDEVLEALDKIGITGSTIIESTGMNRRRGRRQIGATYMAGINRILESGVEGNYTLLLIVPDEQQAYACLKVVEGVVGNLDEPNTGILAAWPLPIIKGVPAQLSADQ